MAYMTFKQREELTDEFFEKCKDILASKGRDYTVNDEALNEIMDTARETNSSPQQVLWIYLKKHYSAVKNYVQRGTLESEPIQSRLMDLSNYFALMYALVEHDRRKNESISK